MDPVLPPSSPIPLRAGLLLLDKPVGLSSNSALQVVRRLVGGIKAGHGGSLDPLASGMLPICLGEATRLAGQLLEGRKAYRFGLKLGERSATGDGEGEIIERCAVPALEREPIEAALQRFVGTHAQTPPMYSALKRSGQPLYRLARAGITVERAARNVQIERLQLLALDQTLLLLEVVCSKGTYVRVLGEDIATTLGTCGRLESLRRLYVEPFQADAMVSLETLRALAEAAQPWPLLPADRAVAHLPALTLGEGETLALTQGRSVPLLLAGIAVPACAEEPPLLWRLYDSQSRFLGLGGRDTEGRLRARRLFPAPVLVT